MTFEAYPGLTPPCVRYPQLSSSARKYPAVDEKCCKLVWWRQSDCDQAG